MSDESLIVGQDPEEAARVVRAASRRWATLDWTAWVAERRARLHELPPPRDTARVRDPDDEREAREWR